MTHAQRFDPIVTPDRVFAPLSHGCPSMLIVTDYSVFKKTDVEKSKVATHKANLPKTKHHKFETITHFQI